MQNIANQIRRKKAWKNKKRIYGIICKNSGLTNYKLSKKIGWTTGKVDYYLKHLLKDGLIKNETSIVNGRVHKTYFSKTVKEFINWDEMTNTKFE